MRKRQVSDFSLRIFFGFWEQNFSDFRPKHFKSFQNYLLRVQRNSLWLEILRHGSRNSIYVSRVKISEETVFLFFFSEFFRILSETFFRLSAKNLQKVVITTFCVSRVKFAEEIFFLFFLSQFFRILSENFSYFWPKNFKKFSKLSSTCPEEQFVAWNCLAWFSKFYLRVQSKNFGRNSFLIFLFRIFSDFERNFFQTFGEKSSKSCQNYFLRVQRNSLWLEISFLKFWIVLDFLQKPSAWFSKLYLRVQSKNCERNSFLIFLFGFFFGCWEKNFSGFRPKNFKKLSKLPSTCPEEQFVAWNFFSKVLNRFGFSAETFGMVLKILSTCPE